jgi:hypothetical protein
MLLLSYVYISARRPAGPSSESRIAAVGAAPRSRATARATSRFRQPYVPETIRLGLQRHVGASSAIRDVPCLLCCLHTQQQPGENKCVRDDTQYPATDRAHGASIPQCIHSDLLCWSRVLPDSRPSRFCVAPAQLRPSLLDLHVRNAQLIATNLIDAKLWRRRYARTPPLACCVGQQHSSSSKSTAACSQSGR